MKKGDKVRVNSPRCGVFGEFVLVQVTGGDGNVVMYTVRPLYEAGWDGRMSFFFTGEVERT